MSVCVMSPCIAVLAAPAACQADPVVNNNDDDIDIDVVKGRAGGRAQGGEGQHAQRELHSGLDFWQPF